MVRFNLALVSLTIANASAASLSSKARSQSEFLATMRAVIKDPKIQSKQGRKMKALTGEILSKAKTVRGTEASTYYSGNSTESYYHKAWGTDDDYDYSDLSNFDITKFSLKVHSCASLSNFDLESFVEEAEAEYAGGQQYEQEAEDSEGIVYPYTGTPMINFRLCPTDTCQDHTWKGCRNVYGNYMIPLEDYMKATYEHLEEELGEYCDYCKQCMYFYKYFNAQCEYYSECESYSNVCSGNNGDDGAQNDVIDYEQYLECTAVEKSYYEQYYQQEDQNSTSESGYYNRRLGGDDAAADDAAAGDDAVEDENVYLKIFCDGNLKIGIFSDDECTNYIGATTTIYKETGLEIAEDDLEADYMAHNCVSCAKKNNQFYVVDQDEDEENGDDASAEDEIYEICETLYEESAQCNARLPYSNYYQYEDGEWDGTVNPITCAFMEAVQKKNIDKYGYVHVSKNKYYGKYVNIVNNDVLPQGYYLSDGQFLWIVGGIVGALSLIIYGFAFKPKQESIQTKLLKKSLV